MSNDQLQSIMALAEQFGWRLADPAFSERQVWVVRQALESAIREAIAAPEVADGWVMVPAKSTPEIDKAIKEVAPRWFAPSVWRSLIDVATAPSPTAEQPVTIKGGNE